MTTLLLDVRQFEHPLPLEKALDAFKKLGKNDVIQMIHRREPIPLFEIITNNGGWYRSIQLDESTWTIYITRDPSIDLGTIDV